MKPVKNKFVICKRDDNSQAEISTFTEDRRGNRLPLILDSAADAVLEIVDHMKCVAEAVKNKDYTEDRLDDAFGDFVANYEMDKTGNVRIFIISPDEYEDEVVYEGSYKSLIVSLN